jgi:hypothetical protein
MLLLQSLLLLQCHLAQSALLWWWTWLLQGRHQSELWQNPGQSLHPDQQQTPHS